jgi:hypothetical protein
MVLGVLVKITDFVYIILWTRVAFKTDYKQK